MGLLRKRRPPGDDGEPLGACSLEKERGRWLLVGVEETDGVPARSSWNSSSSESSVRFSTSEDWRERDCAEFTIRTFRISENKKIKNLQFVLTELWRRLGGDRLFHRASS